MPKKEKQRICFGNLPLPAPALLGTSPWRNLDPAPWGSAAIVQDLADVTRLNE